MRVETNPVRVETNPVRVAEESIMKRVYQKPAITKVQLQDRTTPLAGSTKVTSISSQSLSGNDTGTTFDYCGSDANVEEEDAR